MAMDGLFRPTLDEEIAEVERELEMRRKIFPGRVQMRAMSQAKADRQIALMESVAESLHRLKDLER